MTAKSSSGAVVGQARYYPFGATRFASGTMQTDRLFTGQRSLASLGLMDYKARFYDPALGRFIQPDTITPDLSDPQSLNRYTYVDNNPTNLTDPTGNFGKRRGDKSDYRNKIVQKKVRQLEAKWEKEKQAKQEQRMARMESALTAGGPIAVVAGGGSKGAYSALALNAPEDGLRLDALQWLAEHINFIWRSAPDAFGFLWEPGGGTRLLTVDAPHLGLNYWHVNKDLRVFQTLNHVNIEPTATWLAAAASTARAVAGAAEGYLVGAMDYVDPVFVIPVAPVEDMWGGGATT